MELTLNQRNLIEENMNLVHFVVHKLIDKTSLMNSTCDYEDLVQIGSIGLVNAATHYNEESGKFSTYAVSSIRNEIVKSVQKTETKMANEMPLDEALSYSAEEPSYGITKLLEAVEATKSKRKSLVRAILILKYQGYGNKEVCQMLSISRRSFDSSMKELRKIYDKVI